MYYLLMKAVAIRIDAAFKSGKSAVPEDMALVANPSCAALFAALVRSERCLAELGAGVVSLPSVAVAF